VGGYAAAAISSFLAMKPNRCVEIYRVLAHFWNRKKDITSSEGKKRI
jgi:hypothetical protein